MKKSLKILMLILIICLGGAGAGILLFNISASRTNSVADSLKKYACLSKGNTCDKEDIKNGILLTIPVNKKENVDFYVLSDTKDAVTLISKELFGEKVSWGKTANSEGPLMLMKAVDDITKNWTNIDPIVDYTYEDSGYKYYRDVCIDKTIEDEVYECDNIITGVGYKRLTINNGKVYIVTSYDRLVTLDIENVRARTITVEDINDIYGLFGNEKIEWLFNSEYWTMSSVTSWISGYFANALAVTNNNYNGTPMYNVYDIYVSDDSNPRVRPIITIKKVTEA